MVKQYDPPPLPTAFQWDISMVQAPNECMIVCGTGGYFVVILATSGGHMATVTTSRVQLKALCFLLRNHSPKMQG